VSERETVPGVVPGFSALRIALILGSLFLAIHLLLPQVAGLEATGRRLAHASWWLLGAALLLEVTSFAAYGELTRSVLASGGTKVGRWLMQRIAIVGASLGKTLPGGTTAATAVILRTLVSHGVPAPPALAGLAAAGVLSSAVLGVLLVPSSVAGLASGQGTGLALGAAAAAVVVVATAGLIPVAVRAPDRVVGWVGRLVRLVARGPVGRWVNPDAVAAGVSTGLRSLQGLATQRRAVASAVGWASLNWLADLAVLLVLAVTFQVAAALLSVPLVYIIGQLAAAVPLTPGGVGVVETVMIGTLTAAGSTAAAATAAVLGWRLVSHWLPILVGLALLPTLLRAPRGAGKPAT
jgi:uncharacterized protein (TIRG00374 family)